jgi:hypothetical protein
MRHHRPALPTRDRTLRARKNISMASESFSGAGSSASTSSISVPAATALMPTNRGTQVAILGGDGKVALKAIELGRDLGDTVEVTAGLSPQDQVIDSPPETLQSGDTVQVGPRLNMARSRARPSIWSFVRIDRTCFWSQRRVCPRSGCPCSGATVYEASGSHSLDPAWSWPELSAFSFDTLFSEILRAFQTSPLPSPCSYSVNIGRSVCRGKRKLASRCRSLYVLSEATLNPFFPSGPS